MTIKYIIDRKSLYNGEYDNAKVELISGSSDDKIKLKSHLPVIYRIAKILRKRERKNEG